MNNKGFTLVEVLAVLLIISMLVTIVSVSISSTINEYEKKLSKTQISMIEDAASVYFLKEGIKKSYNNRSFKLCVNLSYLIENDYIEDKSVKSIYNNENLEGSVEITYRLEEYDYKYRENSCNYEYTAIDQICTAVTNDTKTTGNIPEGNYLPGDEYICKVKNNTKYHFFVVSTENDKVNLIMERNVYYNSLNNTTGLADSNNPGLVAWYGAAEDHSYGPITAMNYLHHATKDWDNIPNIIMNYADENLDYVTQEKGTNGYDSIKTTGIETVIISENRVETLKMENLKTRLPRYNEVHGKSKCLTKNENNNQYGSCPLWLVNYLASSDYITGEGLQNIDGISGYWTLSSSADGSNKYAWIVHYYGYITCPNVFTSAEGVRPVITIPKLDIAN